MSLPARVSAWCRAFLAHWAPHYEPYRRLSRGIPKWIAGGILGGTFLAVAGALEVIVEWMSASIINAQLFFLAISAIAIAEAIRLRLSRSKGKRAALRREEANYRAHAETAALRAVLREQWMERAIEVWRTEIHDARVSLHFHRQRLYVACSIYARYEFLSSLDAGSRVFTYQDHTNANLAQSQISWHGTIRPPELHTEFEQGALRWNARGSFLELGFGSAEENAEFSQAHQRNLAKLRENVTRLQEFVDDLVVQAAYVRCLPWLRR